MALHCVQSLSGLQDVHLFGVSMECVSFGPECIDAASRRIVNFVHRTPIFTSTALDALAGKKLYFKAENLQKTGSFKARGAINAIALLKERFDSIPGVITHSSGNHGQALAFAARAFGLHCTVVVPNNAVESKVQAIREYGASIVLCEPTMTSRISVCSELVAKSGLIPIHPHDDEDVMTGQGTVGMEFLEQVPHLDAILVPVGGGGLAAGVSSWIRHAKPGCKVYCVEPEGKNLANNLMAGKPIWPESAGVIDTIADGIRVLRLGTHCFSVVLKNCEKDVLTVSDDKIISAMKLAWQRLKLVIEPTSAISLAAALSPDFRDRQYSSVGVILCGGNVDLERLPWMKKSTTFSAA